jgi:TolA-binding protein
MASIRRSWPALLIGLILLGSGNRSRAQEETPPLPEPPSLPDFWRQTPGVKPPPPLPDSPPPPVPDLAPPPPLPDVTREEIDAAVKAISTIPRYNAMPPARNERALFELARCHLEDQAYHSAAAALEEFLRRYPKSRMAAEATYRLALVHLLQGKDDEARKEHEQLVEKYPASPWAKAVLAAHCGEEPLCELANARRRRAAESGRPEDALAAVEVLVLYASRFPDGKMREWERLYKLGVCQRLAGNEEAFRTAMEEVRDQHKDSDWGKLAAYQLAGKRAFEEGLEELFGLSARQEEMWALLDLAARFGPLPDPKRQVHCQALRARCLSQLGRNREAVALWESLLSEHPDAPEVPSWRLFLAEHYYQLKEVARAQKEYEALAEHYPHSAEAAVARRWAGWLDEHDECWAEVEGLLGRWAELADDFCRGFSGTAVFELPLPGGTIAGRLAFQDAEHFLLRLEAGGKTFLLANNKEGGWLQSLDQPFVLRTKAPQKPPMPCLRVEGDPPSGAVKGVVFLATSDTTPSLTVPPGVVAHLISSLQETAHLGREVLPGPRGGTVYRLEWPAAEAGAVHFVEVEVDPEGRPRALRGTWCAGKGRKASCTLSDLVLGRTPPEEDLAVRIPEGVRVREAEHINTLQCLIELMKLLETWIEKAGIQEGSR